MVANGIPSPGDLGLPEKFDKWRPNQWEAIDWSTRSESRFRGSNIQTGGGKSLTYVAESILGGGRTAILVSTKGLQQQLKSDFASLGFASIEGKDNYQCSHRPGWTCGDGHAGRCRCIGTVECPRSNAYMRAMVSKFVVTNYSCWIAEHKYGLGFGKFDRLILDEAHNAFDELSNAVQIRISEHEIGEMLWSKFPKDVDLAQWKPWATMLRGRADAKAKELKLKILTSRDPKQTWVKEMNHYANLRRKLGSLAVINPTNWVRDEWEYGWQFDCINPARYAESLLFLKIPKVSLLSATIRPKTMKMLGIHDDFEFREFPAIFDPKRSPLIKVPCVKVDAKMSPTDEAVWLMRGDQIIQRRLDRKGTFHTVSYVRRNKVVGTSQFKDIFVTNKEGETAAKMVDRFKVANAPSVLVSPSISTGYDLSYDQCRYQIIGKVPWPDTRSKLSQARQELDHDYGAHIAMQTLEQQCGRGMRAEDDWVENLIIDDHAGWFLRKKGHLASKSFLAGVMDVNAVPIPPEM